MKLGIEAFFLNTIHSGGKEQVLFNLLKGFQALGKAGDIHVYAYDYSADMLKSLIPDATFTFIPYNKIFLKKMIADLYNKTFKLSSLVKQQGIDLLFFPYYNTGFKKFEIPTVVLPHDIQAISNPGRFGLKTRIINGLQYYWDFKLRTRIIAISDYDAREIEKYYPQHQSKIKRIYNPIDTDFSNPAADSPVTQPYICAVNVAYVHKNTLTLIKAYEKIMGKIEHNLLLIGHVNHETKFLKTYVKARHLEDRIQFTGFLDDEELNQVLSRSALFVNPSLFEGFGMTAIEAAIRHVPVLLSAAGASVEVTRSLLNYYEPADDYEVLAEKMLEILQTKPSGSKLAAIRSEYLACYDYMIISSTYYEFFEGMME
ncbi:MAG TPA: glycosyltransferase family 1 protein [Syntrophomonadaceae bacterium]|nr:glycosyltransferase family 1 protein [Syntrophomonadaceae bacterium]HPR92786.1 glycosyltransferase family 1 protein [Syntrophomonadaceae bacterium]